MDLTVCICTQDRPSYLRDCLEGLRAQSVARERFAIVVVDSASRAEAAAGIAFLAVQHGARLIRLDQPGLSVARNAGAWAARTPFIAYIDDDAIPAVGWVAAILNAIARSDRPPALIGGRILPKWEAPLPPWWPASLRGVLSIIEYEGEGECRTLALPNGLEPYGANMVVHVLSLLAAGGFGTTIGRRGDCMLSDEDVNLAWTLQDAGYSVRYNSRIVVHHQIQARRLEPEWLLTRLYWQGASTVLRGACGTSPRGCGASCRGASWWRRCWLHWLLSQDAAPGCWRRAGGLPIHSASLGLPSAGIARARSREAQL